jgi:predicted Zn finger-like uncharacterized protein
VFTQCQKCETVFRLSAEVLRSAGGQVRCGRCGEVFNALARLAEQPDGFTAGESPLELETRAAGILESAPEAAPAAPQSEGLRLDEIDLESDGETAPGRQIAHLVPMSERFTVEPFGENEDSLEENNASLEFTLPPGDLDRIFIGAKPFAPPADLLGVVKADHASAAVGNIDQADHTEEIGHVALVEPEEHTEHTDRADPVAENDAASGGPRSLGFEVPESVRRDMLDEAQRPRALVPVAAERRRRDLPKAWVAAAIVLVLLLSAQIIDHHRASLAADRSLGPMLRHVYAALGRPLPEPIDLSIYQLRQWGVSGEPGSNQTLRVRASILNTAAQFEAFPLLRVRLTNRYGTALGARDFEAAEYLGKPIARRMAPGERADATLDIVDPGKNAEGFEIDVCLRATDRHLTCANDAAGNAS